ncbi:MAG: protease inhibitor I42 family protein [Lachnospiraceae bacterium]|nr:protease inhibitor I42 family protein [Lachnospiraceae bacterium]
MKKKGILVIAVLAAVLAAVICLTKTGSEDTTSYTVEGDDFSAQVNGGELILELPSNATTGYTWVIVEEADIFASDYNSYNESEGGEQLGSGGTTQFHIIALDEGSGTMVFQYRRNWEGGEVAGTYELTLDISRQKGTQLQIDSVSFERRDSGEDEL